MVIIREDITVDILGMRLFYQCIVANCKWSFFTNRIEDTIGDAPQVSFTCLVRIYCFSDFLDHTKTDINVLYEGFSLIKDLQYTTQEMNLIPLYRLIVHFIVQVMNAKLE